MKKSIALLLSLLILFSCSGVFTAPVSAADLTLRVASFNIKNGEGGTKLRNIANQITSYNIDIVGIQEVDMETDRCPYNTISLLTKYTGYKYAYFCPCIPYANGQYGTAVLSKYKMTSFEAIKLYSTREQRNLAHCTINVNGTYIEFYTTHLEDEDENCRVTQLSEINKAIDKTKPFVLTGDFNCSPSTQEKYITDCVSANTPSDKIATYDSGSSIDNITVNGSFFNIDTRSNAVNTLSDHYMLFSDLSFTLGADAPLTAKADGGCVIKNDVIYCPKLELDISAFGAFFFSPENIKATKAADYIGTNTKIEHNGSEYTVSVKMDLDGDGQTTANDCVIMKSYFKSLSEFDAVLSNAADCDSNTVISSTDYVLIKRAISLK